MINVVAAIIFNEEGKVYICQRSENMTLPNYWEFPGGKIESEETEKEALDREIKEELDCEVQINSRHAETKYDYDTFSIRLITYKCILKKGRPVSNEHQDEKWIDLEDLKNYNFAPADIEAVETLMREGS